MATNNAVNTSLSGQTGTGAFAGSTAPAFLLPTANNFIQGYTTTVTSGSTVTLTASSNQQQFFTGSTAQTIDMPVASTLTLGQNWYFANSSTANLTVRSSGANTIVTITPNTACMVTCILTSGTTAASWSAYTQLTQNSVTTFSPTFTCATPGDLSVSYGAQTGRSIVVGALQYTYYSITFTPTFTTASGAMIFGGLPYAVGFTNSGLLVGSISAGFTWPGTATAVSMVCTSGSTNMFLIAHKSATTSTNFTMTSIVSGVALTLTASGILPATFP